MKYDQLATKVSVDKTIASLKGRNVDAEFVNTKEAALDRLRSLVPAGAELMTGGSTTLEQIGFVDLLKSGKHPWKNLKDAILAEKDEAKQTELRKKSVSADYFIASIHAITEDGEVLVASASGSQIPSYAFSSNNVIWVVGTQKIVPTIDEAFKRVKQYVFPLEDQRMKNTGASGSVFGKFLIFEREIMPNRKIKLIFVNEKLGF